MNNSDEMLFHINKVIDILVKGVVHKVRYSKHWLVITEDTLLKADVEMDENDFANLLMKLFEETKWIMDYGVLVDWFAKQDCTIKELAKKIEFVKKQYSGT